MSKKNTYEIIFEDADFIAINKPAGLLTIPDRYNSTLPSAYQLLKQKYSNIYVVHRLDVGTSGVLLFAKNSEAHSFANNQFAEHSVKKIYIAVLEGVLNKDFIEIDIPLLQNPSGKGGVIPSARGKSSLTIINTIERFKNATLIKAQLKTGRLHQLRAHAAAIGYPLLVDNIYGNHTEFYISSIKRRFNLKKNAEELPIISRPTMHAAELNFIHINGQNIMLEAKYPKDFVALIQILTKYAKIV